MGSAASVQGESLGDDLEQTLLHEPSTKIVKAIRKARDEDIVEALGTLRRILKEKQFIQVSNSDNNNSSFPIPEGLKEFVPLTISENASKIETEILSDSESVDKIVELKEQVSNLTARMKKRIDERLREANVLQSCENAIRAGNKDMLSVYQSIWHMTVNIEKTQFSQYSATMKTLRVPEAVVCSQRYTEVSKNYLAAAKAKPAFDRVIGSLVTRFNEGKKRSVVLKNPSSLKRLRRIVEKTLLRPDDPGNSSKVTDIVRAMIVCTSLAECADVVHFIFSAKEIVMRRVKDRFLGQSSSGWRDVLLNFHLKEDFATRHVCEIQIVHESLLTARKGLPGHEIYTKLRNASEIENAVREWERFGLDVGEAARAGVFAARRSNVLHTIERGEGLVEWGTTRLRFLTEHADDIESRLKSKVDHLKAEVEDVADHFAAMSDLSRSQFDEITAYRKVSHDVEPIFTACCVVFGLRNPSFKKFKTCLHWSNFAHLDIRNISIEKTNLHWLRHRYVAKFPSLDEVSSSNALLVPLYHLAFAACQIADLNLRIASQCHELEGARSAPKALEMYVDCVSKTCVKCRKICNDIAKESKVDVNHERRKFGDIERFLSKKKFCAALEYLRSAKSKRSLESCTNKIGAASSAWDIDIK